MQTADHLKQTLLKYSNKEKAAFFPTFFKTGKGQYGEGDQFIGVTVPDQRKIAKQYVALPLQEIQTLLTSKIHEHRLTALLILVLQFQKANGVAQKMITDFYLINTKYVNNWDLVDSSADKILGEYLHDKDTRILSELARSNNIWERRIAIIATFSFIKQGKFEDTIKIAQLLLQDKHDLIHKAVGWMLREVGKKDQAILEKFLSKHAKTMPRTMLRYAIERFSEEKRKQYLTVR